MPVGRGVHEVGIGADRALPHPGLGDGTAVGHVQEHVEQ